MIVSANELNSLGRPCRSASVWRPGRADCGLRSAGQIFQTSGATIREPGILRRSSTILAGRSLNTGAGELARMTIRPFIFASVLPINVRMPWVRLKSPRIAMIGIVRPMTASSVRVGRVIRFCQANKSIRSVVHGQLARKS